MKVGVYGPSGSLGKQVIAVLKDNAVPIYRRDLFNFRGIQEAISECEGVINCAGVIPQKNDTPITMIDVNSRFPHLLAEACRLQGIHCVLVSTDCVFSGRSNTKYQTSDTKDPRDYYGMSKSLGEVLAPHVAVVRTSFINCEHGILNELMSRDLAARSTGQVVEMDGYQAALWTGSTVAAVAQSLIDILSSKLQGIQHLATEQRISKYDLLMKLVEFNDLQVKINPVKFPVVNRALVPTVVLPPLDQALRDFPCRQVQLV